MQNFGQYQYFIVLVEPVRQKTGPETPLDFILYANQQMLRFRPIRLSTLK